MTFPIDVLAEEIATNAHKNQFRRDGVTPYITHPAAVVKRLVNESVEVKAVGWLHDVLEDTSLTTEILSIWGIPKSVVNAVCVLTHKNEESYTDYLESIKQNPIALKVKIADMLDNLSNQPTDKQIIKYARGLLTLVDHV